MTAQIPETLLYDGEKLSMCSEPLGHYFSLTGINPGFVEPHTALWRGYVGTWEILDDRLYLIKLNGMLEDGSEANLETLFPGFPERVFAHWYSGTIRIPRGKMLEYAHMGYGSQYEEDLLITLQKGVVTETRVRRNGESDNPDAPEGYGIGALTTLKQNGSDHGS